MKTGPIAEIREQIVESQSDYKCAETVEAGEYFSGKVFGAESALSIIEPPFKALLAACEAGLENMDQVALTCAISRKKFTSMDKLKAAIKAARGPNESNI